MVSEAVKNVEVIYFLTNPGYSTFMSPYIKQKNSKCLVNSFMVFGYNNHLDGMEVHEHDGSEHIKREINKWTKNASVLVGVPEAFYWSINKVKEKYYDYNSFGVMGSIKRKVLNGCPPLSHNDVIAAVTDYFNDAHKQPKPVQEGNKEGKLEDLLSSIEGLDLSPKIFRPLKKEDINYIAKDCMEYLLGKIVK